MITTFSVEQKSESGNLDSNLIFRQNKLDMTARFMEVFQPKVRTRQTAKELAY